MTTYSSYAGFSSPNFSQSTAAHLSDVTMMNSGSSSTAFESPSQGQKSFSGSSGAYFDTPSLSIKPMQVLLRDLQGTGMKGGFFTSPIAKGSLSTAEALALSFSFSPTQVDKSNYKSNLPLPDIEHCDSWTETGIKFRNDSITDLQEVPNSTTLSFGELLSNTTTPANFKPIPAHLESNSLLEMPNITDIQDSMNPKVSMGKNNDPKTNKYHAAKKRPPPLKFTPPLGPPTVHVNYAPDWSSFREEQPSPAFSAGGELISSSYSVYKTSPITPHEYSHLYPMENSNRSSTPDMGPFSSLSLQNHLMDCGPISSNQFLSAYHATCPMPIGQIPPMMRSQSTPIPMNYSPDNIFSDESSSSNSSGTAYHDWDIHSKSNFYAAPVSMGNICEVTLSKTHKIPSTTKLFNNKRRRASLNEPNNFKLADLEYDDDCASQITSNSNADNSELYSKYWQVFRTSSDQSSSSLSGGKGSGHQSKQYKCLIDECGKCFVRRSGMQTHVQMHLEDKPFACAVPGCHAAFVRSHDLRRHDRIHSGSKTFQCPCGKWFGRGDALAIHRKRGICSGSLVPMKPLKGSRPKRKGKDESEE